ncbi:hypothetical protein AK812_SmicGene35175 [Symbiodinium microadriaticum]|uniref:DUF7869 domain-containing protein n=1 Tax=Symbiodinium microadriaticum TaxID=2951 RepID=A0A1Q9CM61_SYMMI|nr:hypothetical protein AK812_SmicGene35175 [Symbiodinium microadriaticum]CAE7220431.1 unnamed protein product [Symbiodinium sp. KB8]
MMASALSDATKWYLAINESDWVTALSTFKNGLNEQSSSITTPHSFPVGLWHETPEKAIEALSVYSARRLNFSPSGDSESLEAIVGAKAYAKLQLQGTFYCVILEPTEKFMEEFIPTGKVELDEGRLRCRVPPVLTKDTSMFTNKEVIPLLDTKYCHVRVQAYKLQTRILPAEGHGAEPPSQGLVIFIPWNSWRGLGNSVDDLIFGIDLSYRDYVTRNTVKGKTPQAHFNAARSAVAFPSVATAGVCAFLKTRSLTGTVLEITIPLQLLPTTSLTMQFIGESLFPHYRLLLEEPMLEFMRGSGMPALVQYQLVAQPEGDGTSWKEALEHRKRNLLQARGRLMEELESKKARLRLIDAEIQGVGAHVAEDDTAHEFLAEPMPEAPASVLSSYAAAVQAKSFMDPVQTATVHDKEVRYETSIGMLGDTLDAKCLSGADDPSTWLNMFVDGMDMAKFCVTEAISETYCLMDTNIAATANLDMTLLTEEIYQAVPREVLAHVSLAGAGVAWPTGLRVHADNAPSETKNQYCFYWGAWMLDLGLFNQVSFTFYMKGHSHGLPDQRFSELRDALQKASWIEDLQSFRDIIEGCVQGRQGRRLRARHVSSLYDYKGFFDSLETVLSGHVQTAANNKKNLQACHSFMLCKRRVAEDMALPEIESFFSDPPHPDDIIMITKLHMSSEEISQACA